MKLHAGHIEGTQENVAHVLGAYGISEFAFVPIDEGIENTAFKIESMGKRYVLRVYRQNKKPETEILREIQFQELLRENGIPVPVLQNTKEGSPLAVVTIEGKEWGAILMEFIEGKSVTENPSKALLTELAGIQAKIHLLGMEFAESMGKDKQTWKDLHDGHANKIKDLSEREPEVQAFIQRVKEYSYLLNPDLPQGYNHLDIDFDGNVLTNGDHVAAVIDFDDLQYSPVVVCLGFTLWNILDDVSEDAMRHYLQEYEKTRPLNALEYETLPHVLFFRNYVIGITRLLLWDENTPKAEIEDILKLEQDIPKLQF